MMIVCTMRDNLKHEAMTIACLITDAAARLTELDRKLEAAGRWADAGFAGQESSRLIVVADGIVNRFGSASQG